MNAPMSRRDVLTLLDTLGVAYTLHKHPPLATVEDALPHWAGLPGVACKNLFLKDAKAQYWLVSVPFDRVVDLRSLPERIGSRRLSFGRPERLMEVLGILPGSVSPLALVNDRDLRVNMILDRWMMGQDLLHFHPLDNTATVTLSPDGLLRFIHHCGHHPCLVDFDDAPAGVAAENPAEA